MDPIASLFETARCESSNDGVDSLIVIRLSWPDGVVMFDVYADCGDERVCLTLESLGHAPDRAELDALLASSRPLCQTPTETVASD